jgi:hypothetical protein
MRDPLCGIVTIGLVPVVALGSETSWIGPTYSLWSSPSSWSAGVPGPSDTAVFSVVGPIRTVNVGDDPLEVDRIRIAKGLVRFAGSATLDATGLNAFAASITVGSGSLSTTSANWQSSGPLRTARLDVATGTQSLAELVVLEGGLDVLHDARIGVVGNGSLFLAREAGFDWLELGSTSNGFGIVAGSSTLSAAPPVAVRGQCTVGKFGEGLASFSSGTFGALMIGQNAGAHGSVWINDLHVEGPLTIGHGGTGALRITGSASCAGSCVIASHGNPLVPPYLPDSEGSLVLDGGSVDCGGECTVGLGIAEIEIVSGGSIASTRRIRGDERTTLRTVLSSGSIERPTLSAPSISLAEGTWRVEIDGIPAPDAAWFLARSWSSPIAPQILGNPGAGREWRLVQCGMDLFLATAVPGDPDPALCTDPIDATTVPDPDAPEERGFGAGGLALGDGWIAVGCPGGTGSVDVFRRSGLAWIREARLAGPNGRVIGGAVAAHGQRLATLADGGTALVVFVRDGGSWAVEQVLGLNATPATFVRDTLGFDGDRLAVGVPQATVNGLPNAGRVDLYRLANGVWGLEASIESAQVATGSRFGQRVDLSGDRIATAQGSSSSNYFIAIVGRDTGVWDVDASIAGAYAQSFDLEGDSLVCMVPAENTTSMWRPVDGVWREYASVPAYSKPAASAERLVLAQSSQLRFLDPAPGGLWRLGPVIQLETTPAILRTSQARTAWIGGGFLAIVDHLRPTPCPADLTGDGSVDGADLGLLLTSWELSPVGDLNGDGITDGADLGLMLTAFGACEP